MQEHRELINRLDLLLAALGGDRTEFLKAAFTRDTVRLRGTLTLLEGNLADTLQAAKRLQARLGESVSLTP